MPDVTQRDRDLIEAIINAYHTTRLNNDYVPHILSKPMVQSAFARHRTADAARIAELERTLQNLQITANRVSNKYGRDGHDELSDWTEWVDLRAAIASATTALNLESE